MDGDGKADLLLMSAETGEVSHPFVNFPANVSVRDATFTPDGKHLIASFSAMPAKDADSEAEAQRLDNQRYETPQQSPEQ